MSTQYPMDIQHVYRQEKETQAAGEREVPVCHRWSQRMGPPRQCKDFQVAEGYQPQSVGIHGDWPDELNPVYLFTVYERCKHGEWGGGLV